MRKSTSGPKSSLLVYGVPCILTFIILAIVFQYSSKIGAGSGAPATHDATALLGTRQLPKGLSHDHLIGRKDCNGVPYSQLKDKFLKDGYVIFRSCSLERNQKLVDDAAEFTGTITDENHRRADAFATVPAVRDIATDSDTLEMLSYLHNRKAFPFQTLNFPKGTQQKIHSDAVHFDTLPERGLMTAAWVALEDIHPDSGPLVYYPGSHLYPLWDMDELGVRQEILNTRTEVNDYLIYERRLQEAIQKLGLQASFAPMKKGDTLIWAANLLHGGSKVNDPTRTRKSQVTHYFLTGAEKYWAPRHSVPSIDKFYYMCQVPNCKTVDVTHTDCAARNTQLFRQAQTNYIHEPDRGKCIGPWPRTYTFKDTSLMLPGSDVDL